MKTRSHRHPGVGLFHRHESFLDDGTSDWASVDRMTDSIRDRLKRLHILACWARPPKIDGREGAGAGGAGDQRAAASRIIVGDRAPGFAAICGPPTPLGTRRWNGADRRDIATGGGSQDDDSIERLFSNAVEAIGGESWVLQDYPTPRRDNGNGLVRRW